MNDREESSHEVAGSQADVELRFNQMALPQALPDDFPDNVSQEVDAAGLRSVIIIEPGSEERDVLVGTILLVVHFVSAHGLELAVGTAGSALWDGIKAAYRRVRDEPSPAGAPARVLVQYRDGPAIEVDLADDGKLQQVLKELTPGSTPRAAE